MIIEYFHTNFEVFFLLFSFVMDKQSLKFITLPISQTQSSKNDFTRVYL